MRPNHFNRGGCIVDCNHEITSNLVHITQSTLKEPHDHGKGRMSTPLSAAYTRPLARASGSATNSKTGTNQSDCRENDEKQNTNKKAG